MSVHFDTLTVRNRTPLKEGVRFILNKPAFWRSEIVGYGICTCSSELVKRIDLNLELNVWTLNKAEY